MNRRTFLKTSASISSLAMTSSFSVPNVFANKSKATIAFVKTNDRKYGVKKAIELLETQTLKGKSLFVKPNFNSSHTTPGSTHNDTLSTLVNVLSLKGADQITVGDRSGMGKTRKVMEDIGIFRMANELGFQTSVFDELENDDWEEKQIKGSHWKNGFAYPKPVLTADGIIQACCLKTHQYGGHFTLSLKNSVGFAAKTVPGDSHNYMTELHRSDNQRKMIAEINAVYVPELVILDGVDAFINGGPHEGKKVNSNVVIAGIDRIAIDALGVAILRHFGTTENVSKGKIFEQEQIARAVELGLGVSSPNEIEILTDSKESKNYLEPFLNIMNKG